MNTYFRFFKPCLSTSPVDWLDRKSISLLCLLPICRVPPEAALLSVTPSQTDLINALTSGGFLHSGRTDVADVADSR